MWWFKKKQAIAPNEENVFDSTSIQSNEATNPIPKDKFIMEEAPVNSSKRLPIYEIYKRFQEDWEVKGYNDAIRFPETTYRDNQKKVIIDQLRLAIKESLLHYEDKLVDIDIHLCQVQKNGLMETYDKYMQEKKKLIAHRDELAVLNKDAEEIGEKTQPILMSYDMGFTRGLVSLSNEKISEIMNQ